jgi:hypothetical protein
MKNKLITLAVSVPYKRAGNVISQQEVNFDVYWDEDHYSLHPLLTPDEREIANLPESLNFIMEDGKPVSLRGIRDGNLHVIEDAVIKLKNNYCLPDNV